MIEPTSRLFLDTPARMVDTGSARLACRRGAEDPTFPIEQARRMVTQFPDARLVEIPGSRLLVHEERPADVARAAIEFLG